MLMSRASALGHGIGDAASSTSGTGQLASAEIHAKEMCVQRSVYYSSFLFFLV